MEESKGELVDSHKEGNILKWKVRQARLSTLKAVRTRLGSQGTESSDLALGCAVTGAAAGTESLDSRLSSWCERLNRIPGVSTVHSSPGHRSIEGHLFSGHLWIALDGRLEDPFIRMVFSLSREIQYVERVSRIYTSWGQQIIEIVFAGSERGLLSDSMELICGFFEALAESSIQNSS